MSLGEMIVEFGFRLVLEFIIYGIGYWVGFCVLNIFTLGKIKLASFSTIQQRNKVRRIDWSIYLHQGDKKLLKAEVTAFIGMIFLFAAGFIIYLFQK